MVRILRRASPNTSCRLRIRAFRPRRGRRVMWIVVAVCLNLVPATPRAIPEEPAVSTDFRWTPEVSPVGPTLIVVSIGEQRAWIYRNGVRIGDSAVSTGMPGHETPTGVYRILEKRRMHFSNLYDDAPMPFMQRLTWDGVALHAGHVPGFPASHGCIRLPMPFAEKLFGITARGMTVVIVDRLAAPMVAAEEPLAAADQASAPVSPTAASTDGTGATWHWSPERAPTGPMSIVLSSHDGALVVLRNAIMVGRAALAIDEPQPGLRVYVLLGPGDGASRLVPGRPALRWLALATDGAPPEVGGPVSMPQHTDVRIDPRFARLLYDALEPGATVVATDEPLADRIDRTVLEANADVWTAPVPCRADGDSTPER